MNRGVARIPVSVPTLARERAPLQEDHLDRSDTPVCCAAAMRPLYVKATSRYTFGTARRGLVKAGHYCYACRTVRWTGTSTRGPTEVD